MNLYKYTTIILVVVLVMLVVWIIIQSWTFKDSTLKRDAQALIETVQKFNPSMSKSEPIPESPYPVPRDEDPVYAVSPDLEYQKSPENPVSYVDLTPMPVRLSSTKKVLGHKKPVVSMEDLCRSYLEKKYGKLFPKCRPDFLLNPETDQRLELDGYCDELGMAFEYQGKQHCRYDDDDPKKMHKSYKDFINQVRRDVYKREVCEKRGINLIIIDHNVEPDEIPLYIDRAIVEFTNPKISKPVTTIHTL
jgi:hypothetical protein